MEDIAASLVGKDMSPCAHLSLRWIRPAFVLLAASAGLALTAQQTAPTPLYRWTTLAGKPTTGYNDGPAAEALFDAPHGVAIDANGNLFVADCINHTIRKISPQGMVTTIAGSHGEAGSADGTGSAAQFNLPKGVAVDPQGNVYVADSGNHVVRKITPDGVVNRLAGAPGMEGSTDGTGDFARFAHPVSIFADAAGNVYVQQQHMRRISPGGTVTTINLTGTITTPDGAVVTLMVDGPAAVDSLGNIFFVARAVEPDGSLGTTKRIVKRDAAGAISVLASSDPDDGKPSISTSVTEVIMATDAAGNLYFVTQLVSSIFEYALHQISPDGVLVRLPWSGAARGGYGDYPRGLAIGADGKIFHTAPALDDVIFLNEGSTTGIYAGTLWSNHGVDGAAGANASFSDISGLAYANGRLLVGDNYSDYHVHPTGGASVRTVSSDGEVSTFYTGPSFERPPSRSLHIAALNAGDIALATYTYGHMDLARIAPDGSASPLPKGNFTEFVAMASDSSGRLFVAERRALHRREPDGTWSLLAGNSGQPADIIDGNAGNARFSNITSLAVAPNGDAFVIDHQEIPLSHGSTSRIVMRRIQPNGNVTTLENFPIPDGGPLDFAIDAKGDFILTCGDDTVRLLTADGTEFIIGGTSGQRGVRDGDGQSAQFYRPDSITTDAENNVFVADNAAVTIRKGEFLGYSVMISKHPESITVSAGATAQISVTASGTPAPTYQWQFNGTAIAGATGTTLSLSNVSSANAGSYTVVVSNANGSVTSNAATLSVITPNPPPNNGGGTNPPPTNGSGGGGGAPSLWFLGMIAALGLLRHWGGSHRE